MSNANSRSNVEGCVKGSLDERSAVSSPWRLCVVPHYASCKASPEMLFSRQGVTWMPRDASWFERRRGGDDARRPIRTVLFQDPCSHSGFSESRWLIRSTRYVPEVARCRTHLSVGLSCDGRASRRRVPVQRAGQRTLQRRAGTLSLAVAHAVGVRFFAVRQRKGGVLVPRRGHDGTPTYQHRSCLDWVALKCETRL